jgi:hypothetical protein
VPKNGGKKKLQLVFATSFLCFEKGKRFSGVNVWQMDESFGIDAFFSNLLTLSVPKTQGQHPKASRALEEKSKIGFPSVILKFVWI